MSVWGKILGGAAGFAFGGPIGALLGVMAGHVVDRRAAEAALPGADEDGTKRIAFTIGVIVLSAKMAKADGQVTRDEIAIFKRLFHVPSHEIRNVGRLFDQARQDAAGYESYARQIATLFTGRPAVLEDLLDSLFMIAKADGEMHPAELEFLSRVASIFGFSDADFTRIRAGHLGADKADPYTVLGIGADASDEDVKKAYRLLIKQHHPDTLIAQGMPEEFITAANDKMAAINAAYNETRLRRGLK